jgi:hypothetical protein
MNSPSRDRVEALHDFVLACVPPTGRPRRVPLMLDHLVGLGAQVLADRDYKMPPAILATLLLLPDRAWRRAADLARKHDQHTTVAAVEEAELLALFAGFEHPRELAGLEFRLAIARDRGRLADEAGSTWITRRPSRPRKTP